MVRSRLTSILTAIVTSGAVVAAANVVAAPQPDPGAALSADPGIAALQRDIDQILADPRLEGGQAGVLVADAETGEVLYEHDADTRLLPASNEKLMTSVAAMDLLGADYRFTTSVAADGPVSGGVLRGDLYLKGTGDPTLLDEDYADLAAQLAAAGVRRVIGGIVADDTWFDDQRLGSFWSWDDEPYYYSAQISALSAAPDTDYDAGTVIVRATPSDVGKSPDVTIQPETDYLAIVNEAVTTEAGTGTALSIEREHGSNRVLVTGTVAADSSGDREWVTVWEPTGYAADVFRHALEDHGIAVHGETGYGATPSGATVVAEHQSMPLAELMTPFMKLSNNGHAEVLIKAMGREVAGAGTWGAGIAVMRDHLADSYGVDLDTIRHRDGSGLSRGNLITPRSIAATLREARDEPWFDEWYDALPIAGNPARFVGGTLRSRMRNTAAANNVHGKTGSLTGVSALSGYVTDADGRDLVFSIVLNDYLSGKPSDLEDAIAVRLAENTDSGSPQVQAWRNVPEPRVDLPDTIECSWVKDAC